MTSFVLLFFVDLFNLMNDDDVGVCKAKKVKCQLDIPITNELNLLKW